MRSLMLKSLSVLTVAAALAAPALAVPVQWTVASGGNGHFYELVLTTGTWPTARTAASAANHLGQQGYLVTITSAAENQFLLTSFDALTNSFVWIGATDQATEGVWLWIDGPEAGVQFSQVGVATAPFNFENWGPVEPNNAGNEDVAALNLGGLSAGGTLNGQWGDTGIQNSFAGYIVEYGVSVPEPFVASLLACVGFALLGARHRRRTR